MIIFALKVFLSYKIFLIEPTVLIIVPNICTYVANHVFRGPALQKTLYICSIVSYETHFAGRLAAFAP